MTLNQGHIVEHLNNMHLGNQQESSCSSRAAAWLFDALWKKNTKSSISSRDVNTSPMISLFHADFLSKLSYSSVTVQQQYRCNAMKHTSEVHSVVTLHSKQWDGRALPLRPHGESWSWEEYQHPGPGGVITPFFQGSDPWAVLILWNPPALEKVIMVIYHSNKPIIIARLMSKTRH